MAPGVVRLDSSHGHLVALIVSGTEVTFVGWRRVASILMEAKAAVCRTAMVRRSGPAALRAGPMPCPLPSPFFTPLCPTARVSCSPVSVRSVQGTIKVKDDVADPDGQDEKEGQEG